MYFEDLLARFKRYVAFNTQSDENSPTFPSTAHQFDLANLLKEELLEMGVTDVQITEHCYLIAKVKSNQQKPTPRIALIAHLDTSPDVSGKDVRLLIHQNYSGGDILLNEKEQIVLKAADNPYLLEKKGMTILTSDGSTLLGADDKAGIAEIMSAVNYLLQHPEIPRPEIRIIFTPDEEIGRGVDRISVEQIDADYGYTVDGEKLGEIEDETFCADSLEIKIQGVNVHPGMAKGKMVNAIKIAAELITMLPKDKISPETTEKKEGYLHPHQISGGVEEVTLKFLIRDFQENGLIEKEEYLKEIASQLNQRFTQAKISVSIQKSYRNMKIVLDKHPHVLEKAEEAIRRSGLTPKRAFIRGGTDGARLCFMGLPTPNLFTGGNNFHSRTEWIALEDMQKATEVLVNLLQVWAEN